MTAELFKVICIVGPILGLFVMGFGLTLRSGVVGVGSGHGLRQMVGNLWWTLALVAVCLLGLLMIQQALGIRMATGE